MLNLNAVLLLCQTSDRTNQNKFIAASPSPATTLTPDGVVIWKGLVGSGEELGEVATATQLVGFRCVPMRKRMMNELVCAQGKARQDKARQS